MPLPRIELVLLLRPDSSHPSHLERKHWTMTSSTTLSSCCISGHLHEGTTRGNIVKLHDLDTYVTGSEEDKKRTVVFITDIFGYKLKVKYTKLSV